MTKKEIERPPKKLRYFRCRTDKCGTMISLDLNTSIGNSQPLVCPICNARWFASYDYSRKSCCGRVSVKFVKDTEGAAIAFIQTFHK